jgi:hypothetical protein
MPDDIFFVKTKRLRGAVLCFFANSSCTHGLAEAKLRILRTAICGSQNPCMLHGLTYKLGERIIDERLTT